MTIIYFGIGCAVFGYLLANGTAPWWFMVIMSVFWPLLVAWLALAWFVYR